MAVVTVLALTGALTIATTTLANATSPDLSSDSAINTYLTSIGVNPADAVWQRSLRNYAGPGCPGRGWNCVPANAPIVQVALPGGTNVFACPASRCVNVQVALFGGDSASACLRTEQVGGEAVQSCDIIQAGTTGTNAAGVAQHIQQTRGSDQRARQIARITQTNETGSNIARIIQGIGQSSRLSGGSPTQIQEAHQAGTVTQTTESLTDPDAALGDNTSNIRQIQDQLERASGSGASIITQDQNTDPTGTDPTCDQPGDLTFDQAKNQCAQVTQHSGVLSLPPSLLLAAGGGDNRSTLNHQTTQRQFAENAGTVNQAQGAFSTGEAGTKEQLSSGVSTSQAFQDTVQNQTAPLSGAAVTQTQNTGDPRCCQTQADNPADTADIMQATNQTASSPDATQLARFQGDCDTTGTCHVRQSATIDGETETNTCDGNFCQETFVCVPGEFEGSNCQSLELT